MIEKQQVEVMVWLFFASRGFRFAPGANLRLFAGGAPLCSRRSSSCLALRSACSLAIAKQRVVTRNASCHLLPSLL